MEIHIEINGERTALIVVDVQNAFCSPKGSMARIGLDTTWTSRVVAPVASLVELCRGAGLPIIFVRYVLRPDFKDGGLVTRELFPGIKEAQGLVAGTWDAELVDELKPQPGDFVVDKTRYSAFYGTNLESLLHNIGVDTILLCGTTTEICVDSTARDALARDFRVLLVSDACAALDKERHDAALKTAAYGIARLLTVDEVTAALGAGP